MPKFAANLNWLFTELDFPDRFEAAAKAGFRGVECLFPYDFPASELKQRLADTDIQAVLINAPPGDWSGGDRGLGSLQGRESEFRESVALAIAYASEINCPNIHIMAGIAGAHGKDKFIENLHFAGEACAKAGLFGLIEPINDIDMPGYFLTGHEQALDILRAVGSTSLGLQLDIYHVARMGRDPFEAISVCADQIAHFQIASVPERHEPIGGEVNYPELFKMIDAMKYNGWIGCEYQPRSSTLSGLGWMCQD